MTDMRNGFRKIVINSVKGGGIIFAGRITSGRKGGAI